MIPCISLNSFITYCLSFDLLQIVVPFRNFSSLSISYVWAGRIIYYKLHWCISFFRAIYLLLIYKLTSTICTGIIYRPSKLVSLVYVNMAWFHFVFLVQDKCPRHTRSGNSLLVFLRYFCTCMNKRDGQKKIWRPLVPESCSWNLVSGWNVVDIANIWLGFHLTASLWFFYSYCLGLNLIIIHYTLILIIPRQLLFSNL